MDKKPQQSYRSSSRKAAVSPRTVEGSGVGGAGSAGGGGSGGGPGSHVVGGAGSVAGAAASFRPVLRHQQAQHQPQQQQQQLQQLYHPSASFFHHPHYQAHYLQQVAAAAAAANSSSPGPLAMNSGPAGGPGQPPAGLQPPPPSVTQASRDQHSQPGSDPNLNITIMNITVPPVVPVPAGLRFVHPYLPPPPHPHPPPQSVAPVVQVASSNSASPVSASSGPPSSVVQQQQQQQQVSRQQPSPAVATSSPVYTRDVYRNASPNVNERVAISVSSSPVSSQVVGVGSDYVISGRCDRPRISLLPAPASIAPAASPTAPTDYHSAAARNNRSAGPGILAMQPQEYRPSPVDMAQLQQDSPPFKKIRLGQPAQQLPPTQQQQQQPQQQQQQSISQTDCQRITSGQDTLIKHKQHVQLQPLRIDTRPTAGVYTPQTEAISPTLPEPNTQEDVAFRTTKDDLLQQIAKVDREIAKRESMIQKLRKKLKELEEVAGQPFDAGKRPVEEASQQPKHQSLAQKIYAENRKKAEEAHRLLEKLGPKVKLPLYNQPSDTSVYQENRTRHQCMKARLAARLRKEHAERASLHRQQSQTYAILVQEWHRKVEKIEATQKRKTKEAKNREFFEKVFPELRKQREDKERFNRVGARIKSEADLEEIMDGLQEQEEELSTDLNALKARQMEDKKMRSYAVIPPLLLDAKQRKLAFQNRNGLLQPEELEALHSERKLINVWSTTEHDMFKEKYLQHPKNFGAIAQSFEHKSVADCVHHYYLTKKTENYKQLLRKSRRTRSSRNNPNNKVNNSNSTIGPIDILTTGVTTRLQREQQQKTQENPQNSAVASSSSSSSSVTTTTSASSATTSSSITSTTVTSASSATTSSSSAGVATSSSSSNSAAAALSLASEPSATTATTTITSSASAAAASASVPSTSATTTTSSVLTTTSTSSASVKDAREANKENKEIKTEPKDSILIKDIKEESHSSSETLSSRESKIEGKGALSSSSNSSVVNANNPSNVDQQQKDKKKNAGITGGSAITSRTKEKKKENHATPMETSDEEAQGMDAMECSGRQLGPHPCVICQTTVEAGNQSRPLSRSQASQYGLREDQVPAGARVCNTCRCKSVRGRYTTCPLPGCPNLSSASSKTRVKRLRALPSKWNDLPAEIRDPIIQEFQIPSNTTKCCSACFNRISRRLAPHFSGVGTDGTNDEADAITRQWSEEELELLKKALREHGTNWPKVSEQISGKSNHQCKNYYLTYRKKLGLDQVVAEYYQSLGEERRPCLTDEEESGSSTSSCDELAVHDTSDTASAGSPANTISSSTPTASAASSSSATAGGVAAAVGVGGGVAAVSGSSVPPFPQSQDVKVGEKLADVAVVSLVAPSPMTSSQPPQTNPPTSTREDYDSSATETADEGQGSADLENSGGVVMSLATAGVAPGIQVPAGSVVLPVAQTIIQTQPQPPALVQSPPSTTTTTTNNNPITVKDLMLGVIEMQLKRNQNSPGGVNSSVPVSTGTPTISSILKTDHRNDITFVRELRPASQTPNISNTAIPNRDPNLATLSVVTGPHHGHRSASSPQQISQMQATITPCPPSTPSQPQAQPANQELPNEGLVVMQLQQAMRETEGTLDLSIKKPRTQQEYNHALQPPSSHKPPASVGHYRPEPPPPATYYHSHGHSEPQGRTTKSPHVYTSSPRPQAPITPKVNKVSVPPTTHPKLSPKLTNMTATHKTGSITHGTPVSGARYEGMLRQMTPPGSASQPNPSTTPDSMMIVVGSKESGSITQGTPVHPFAVDKRSQMYDYHRSIRHSPVTTTNVPAQASQNSGVVVSHGQSSSSQYNSYPSRQAPSYTMEQLSSRQIIMNDYITSQQMHPRNRSTSSAEASTKNEVPTTLYCANTPPPQSHSQPRQGVIQRHNTQKHYAPPPPGLEAFSSLVDVAVQQPSLPVPHPPPASTSGHEGLCMSIERMYSDRYAMDNRSLQNMPRMARQQAAQYQMAVAMQQREEQRERERDLLIREKQQQEQEEQQQRLQREREKDQQQQQLHHQQQMERIHQREKEIQQQQEHRLAQQREQEMHQAAAAQAAADHRIAVQREKEIQQQQQREQQQSHVDHRMSIHQQQQQQQREKDMQQQHYRIVQQQREKEMMAAAAAQREKEHQEHRLAVQQREKEIQAQQELRLVVQKREKELQQQQDHRLVYLQQQQQRYQKHMQHQQQRMEAERRQIVQIYKDQQEAHMYRELAERQCESPSAAKSSGFFQPSRIQQQPQPQPPPPSSRHSSSSSNQQGEYKCNFEVSTKTTLTAASLIDAIITHQINLAAGSSSDSSGSNNQPTRPGDRLFQGFHRDNPAEANGMAHSPAGEENTNRESSSGSGSGSGTKGLTLGEHVEHVVSKDYGPPMSSYRPYQGNISEEQWKRRKGAEADSVKSGDERQIIRVAQQKPASSQSQSSHQSQSVSSKQQQPPTQFHTEPVSPPEPTSNHYPRRFYEPSTATTATPVTPSNKSHLSPLDYVKNKIVEVMRTEDDKTSSGDRNGGGNDKDDKCADSSPSGEMVIDESPSQQQQAPPPQSQPPPPTPTTFYPFNALGVHTGPPPAPPPSSGGTTVTVVKSEEPAPILSAQYEPLSDED